MNYPELMEALEELYNHYADTELDDTTMSEALWIAIVVVQGTEAKDGRVSNVLKYLEEKDKLNECPSCGEECENDPCEWCGHSEEFATEFGKDE